MSILTKISPGALLALLLMLICSSLLLGQPKNFLRDSSFQRGLVYLDRNDQEGFRKYLMNDTFPGAYAEQLLALCAQAIAHGRELKDPSWEYAGHRSYANVYFYSADLPSAQEHVEKAKAIQPEVAESDFFLLLQEGLNHMYKSPDKRQWGTSIKLLTKAIDIAESMDAEAAHAYCEEIAYAYKSRGMLYWHKDEPFNSIRDLYTALRWIEKDGVPRRWQKAEILINLGEFQKKFERAEVWQANLRDGANTLMETGTERDSLWAMYHLLSLSKEVAEGEHYFREGRRLDEMVPLTDLRQEFLSAMLNLYYKHGVVEPQAALVDTLLMIYTTPSARRADILTIRANLMITSGKYAQGIALAKQALSMTPDEIFGVKMRAALCLSEAYAASGKPSLAYEQLKAANAWEKKLTEVIDEKAILSSSFSEQLKLEKQVIMLESEQNELILKQRINRQWWFLRVSALGILLLVGFTLYVYRTLVEKRKAEQQLLEQQQLLERKNAQLNSFSGVVSHDILSNLELIIAAGNVLVRPSGDKSKLFQYHEMTQQLIITLKAYCLELLKTARQGKDNGFTSEAEGNALLADTIKHYDSLFAQLDFEIVTERLPPMPLPKVVLEQFLHNGITNVLKHAHQSDTTTKVTIGGNWDEHETPYWYIEDNGCGLNESVKIEQIGSKHVLSIKGVGMGLKKLKSQLSFYGANLLFESEKNKGARLTLTV